jgi:hypothetical protein
MPLSAATTHQSGYWAKQAISPKRPSVRHEDPSRRAWRFPEDSEWLRHVELFFEFDDLVIRDLG